MDFDVVLPTEFLEYAMHMLGNAQKHRLTWRDKDEVYWALQLHILASQIVLGVFDNPEDANNDIRMAQLGGILLNWMHNRDQEKKSR
jgi:hypothetical protein